jgi:hypothetical protein
VILAGGSWVIAVVYQPRSWWPDHRDPATAQPTTAGSRQALPHPRLGVLVAVAESTVRAGHCRCTPLDVMGRARREGYRHSDPDLRHYRRTRAGLQGSSEIVGLGKRCPDASAAR